ncbi:MAG: hypothetical protein KGL39_37430 [Patescibacteria group bacterium]|nr:hypothetical protein [Patescibacteria group bacterium]
MRKFILAISLLLSACSSSPALAQQKISQMPAGGALQSSDLIPIVRSGANYTVNGSAVMGGVTWPTNGTVVISNGTSSPAGVTVSGDGVLNTTTGALNVTGTSGTPFAASATINTTNASNISSGTLPNARVPAPTTVALGGIVATSGIVANQWMTYVDTSGVQHTSQPAFSNLSGSATVGQLPTATSSSKGIVQGDGNTLTITSGTMSCTTATSSQVGCSKPDGTTITSSGGILTAVTPAAPLGTSAAVPVPFASAIDTQTGLYTSGTGKINFTSSGSNIVQIGSAGIAVGTTLQTAGTSLDLGKTTTSELLPVGTTGQRPGTGANGMIRYNSTLNTLEGYVNASWQAITTGGNFAVNVTAWPFHAACDGTTNDTSAFTSAAATGLKVFIPPSTSGCALSSFQPPSNSSFEGTSAPQYTSNPSSAWSHVVPASGATAIWNYNGITGVTVKNLDTLGSPSLSLLSNVACINAGSTAQHQFLFSSYRYCGNGGFGDAGHYPNTVISIDTNWIGNGTNIANSGGLVNLVDSEIDGGSFTVNLNGLSFGPGANNNVISPMTRIEFNANAGVLCNGATKELIDGQYDHNYNEAISFTNCGRSTGLSGNGSGVDDTGVIDGITVRGIYTRNGSTGTVGNQAHFEFGSNNTNITFNGISTSHDCGDPGCTTSGPNAPKYIVEYADSSNSGIRFVGGNLNGYSTAFGNNITGTGPTDYGIVGGLGVESIYPYNNTFNGAVNLQGLPNVGAPTVSNVGTSGSSTWSYVVVATLANGSIHTAASTAGTTTTGNATLSTLNYNVISWTKVAGAYQYQVYRTAHGTSPSTNGLIATIPATQNLTVLQNVYSFGGGGQLWDTGLSGDSSTAPTTNNTGLLAVGSSLPQGVSIAQIQGVGSVTSGRAYGTYDVNIGGGTVPIACHGFGSYNGWTGSYPASICGVDNNWGDDIEFLIKQNGAASNNDQVALYLKGDTNADVNYIQIQSAPTISYPSISVAGSDTNSGIGLVAKGTGNILIPTGNLGIGTNTPAATVDAYGTIKTRGYTVGTLPSGVIGMHAYVTDATSCTFLGALTGGGSTVCPVFFDGTSWKGG